MANPDNLPAVIEGAEPVDPRLKPVGLPGASQAAGIPDIHYLWGPGRLLAQQMQFFSAALVFASLPFLFLGLMGIMPILADASGNDQAFFSQSVSWDNPRHPANRRPSFAARSPVLHVDGVRFSPADPAIDWRRISAPPRRRVAEIVQQAMRDLPSGDPWSLTPLRNVSVSEFWRTPIPFGDGVVGSIARTTIDGVEWTLIGTYAGDVALWPVTQQSAGVPAADRQDARRPVELPPAAPVILVQRVDRRSPAPQNRFRIWQLADPALASSLGSTLARPEVMLHDIQPSALSPVWERLAPGVTISSPF